MDGNISIDGKLTEIDCYISPAKITNCSTHDGDLRHQLN